MTQPTSGSMPSRGRAPVSLNVARGDAAARYSEPVDWRAWYLTDEDDMGQSPTHDDVVKVLERSVEVLLSRRERTDLYCGRDQFFGWRADHPLVRVSPDVFVLSFVPERPYPDSWQVWREGHEAPRLAFEVVSQDWKKDYEDNPAKYAQLGVEELVIFDPMPRGGRAIPIQVFRWSEDGVFVQTAAGAGPIYCEYLDVWLVSEEVVGGRMLRLSETSGPSGLVPTTLEAWSAAREAESAAREAESAAREAESAAREAESAARSDAERERLARVAAEDELARLRAQLVGDGPGE